MPVGLGGVKYYTQRGLALLATAQRLQARQGGLGWGPQWDGRYMP
jgi:hypothetical protein